MEIQWRNSRASMAPWISLPSVIKHTGRNSIPEKLRKMSLGLGVISGCKGTLILDWILTLHFYLFSRHRLFLKSSAYLEIKTCVVMPNPP